MSVSMEELMSQIQTAPAVKGDIFHGRAPFFFAHFYINGSMEYGKKEEGQLKNKMGYLML